jgi:Amino acid permease
VVGVFLVLGSYFLFHHPELARANWHPYIPPSDGHGNFGWHGIAAGAASIFFAYIGFDAVSTAAQEAKNPQKDMPFGILGSLVICTILYILVSTVLTGLVNYKSLNVADPVALGIDATGVSWGSLLVKIGAVFGLGTVMLVMLLGQSRVGVADSSEVSDAVDFDDFGGRGGGDSTGIPDRRTAGGTGEHWHFVGIHDCLRGGLGVAAASPWFVSAVQDAVCSGGADSGDDLCCLFDVEPSAADVGSNDWLVAVWFVDLLWLFDQAQQGAEAG